MLVFIYRCVSQEENDKVLEENKVLLTRYVAYRLYTGTQLIMEVISQYSLQLT